MHTIDIALHWRWLLALAATTTLLAQHVLPARLPTWDVQTLWLTSLLAVLAAEAGLLLHELSHALVARGRGQEVSRIVFHGFVAETVLTSDQATPRQEALIALVGPVINLCIAAAAQIVRVTLNTSGPSEVMLMLLVLGNIAAATMSLLPFGASDGARVMRALKRARGRTLQREVARQGHDQNDQDE